MCWLQELWESRNQWARTKLLQEGRKTGESKSKCSLIAAWLRARISDQHSALAVVETPALVKEMDLAEIMTPFFRQRATRHSNADSWAPEKACRTFISASIGLF